MGSGWIPSEYRISLDDLRQCRNTLERLLQLWEMSAEWKAIAEAKRLVEAEIRIQHPGETVGG